MADKAVRSENGEEEVIDLSNDARWQERLAEARERRAEALKNQPKSATRTQKRRMPWEDELDALTIKGEPVIFDEVDDDEGFDFFHRIDALKKSSQTGGDNTLSRYRPNTHYHPAIRNISGPTQEVEAVDDQTTDFSDGLGLDTHTEVPTEMVDVSNRLPVDSYFEEISARGSRESATEMQDEGPASALLVAERPMQPPVQSRPWLNEPEDLPNFIDSPAKQKTVVQDAAPKKKRQAARWVLAGIAAAAIGPIITLVPQYLSGPVGPAEPYFALVPALGVPASLVELPSQTISGELIAVPMSSPSGPIDKTPLVAPTLPSAVAAIVFVPEVDAPPDISAPSLRGPDSPVVGRGIANGLPRVEALRDRELVAVIGYQTYSIVDANFATTPTGPEAIAESGVVTR